MPDVGGLPRRAKARVQVDADSGCWLWIGTINKDGYGQFCEGSHRTRTTSRAHRWMWVYFNGPIPPQHEMHHKCHVRRCVNPSHLEPVLKRDHPGSAAAIHAARTCCSTCGGPYHLDNRGKRACRMCRRIACRKYYAKQMEQQRAQSHR